MRLRARPAFLAILLIVAVIAGSAPVTLPTFAPQALATGCVTQNGLLGPTPYLRRTDSPFSNCAFQYFHLEDFEDGVLNVPNVTADTGAIARPDVATLPIGLPERVDSVDADDGVVDGNGSRGKSYVFSSPATFLTFRFQAGLYPTHAGLVWTDGDSPIRFEAFDANGTSLGTVTGNHADGPHTVAGNDVGQTAEDRFYGVVNAQGISAIRVYRSEPGGAEVDHLQYGRLGQQNPPNNPNECVVVRAWTHRFASRAISGGPEHGPDYAAWTGVSSNGTYAAKPATLPANVTWIDYDMFANTLNGTVIDTTNPGILRALSDVDLFLLSDTNTSVPDGSNNRRVTAPEIALIDLARKRGMDMIFVADNGGIGSTDDAAQGTIDILNGLQAPLNYSAVNQFDTSGVRTAIAAIFPFLAGIQFDFSFRGNKETPGLISVTNPAQCAIETGGLCRVAFLPEQGNDGFIFVSGNAWAGSAQFTSNLVARTCGSLPQPQPVPQCRDGRDNDGDGLIDFPADPGCLNPDDDDEFNQPQPRPQCSDGIDNADPEDTLADSADPGCHSDGNVGNPNSYNPSDNDETNAVQPTFQCSDNRDNDGDGLIDFPADPGCFGPTDNDEFNQVQCPNPQSTTNLIVNPSFEDSLIAEPNECKPVHKGLTAENVAGWDKAYDGVGNTYFDPFHFADYQDKRCPVFVGPPNYPFLQNPYPNQSSDGNRNATAWVGAGVSEYFQGSLTQPLVPGQQYTVSFDIMTLDLTGVPPSSVNYAGRTIEVGLDFMEQKRIVPGNFGITLSGGAGLVRPPLITLTNNYQTITATFTATNASRNFIFGSFVGMRGTTIANAIASSVAAPVAIDNFKLVQVGANNQCPQFQCSDNRDNDGDGLVDFPNDPGCFGPTDDNEFNQPQPRPQCSDGIDNTDPEDTLADNADPGCHTDGNANNPNSYNPNDNDETNAPPTFQCSDNRDNDGDGLIDFPADPGCASRDDDDEFNIIIPPPPVPQCRDGRDNDGDGNIDMQDPGCSHPDDNDEFNPPVQIPQCRDGIDNDGDGRIDMNDPGCSHPDDNDETNVAIPPPPTAGCVEVLIEGFGLGNNPLPVLPGFTVTLDGSQTLTTSASGRATFNGVSTGDHAVFQSALAGWSPLSVTPSNGQVTVTAGGCVGVIFKNRQELPSNPVFTFTAPDKSAEELFCEQLANQYGSLSKKLKSLKKKGKKSTSIYKIVRECVNDGF